MACEEWGVGGGADGNMCYWVVVTGIRGFCGGESVREFILAVCSFPGCWVPTVLCGVFGAGWGPVGLDEAGINIFLFPKILSLQLFGNS